MNKIKKKLVFGTANLGVNYGINSSNISKDSSLKKIFLLLKKEKVFFIDTAYNYKNAEKCLGKQSLKKFKLITKLPKIKEGNLNILEKNVVSRVKKSLKKLNISHFYSILIHDTKELNGSKGKKIFNILKVLKKKKNS